MTMKVPVPKLHPTGQAYVKWQGKPKYFGKFGTPKAEEKYRAWIVELYGNKSKDAATSPLVVDLIAEYTKAHDSESLKDKLKAIKDLGPLAGHHCHEYSPLVFRRHRDRVASLGKRCARHVNDLMRMVQRIFRWGVSMEMVGIDVYHKLKTVDPLKAHEVKHQSKKRLPAKREDVLKTLEEMDDMPAAMVRLILYTGARPGEICGAKPSELSKDGPNGTWVTRPDKHKTQYRGKRRYVVYGPMGQAILRHFWPKVGDWFFPSALVVGHYRAASLRQAVVHACKRAGVPKWTPYQLRHLRMTELAVDKGLEVAASVAGHGEKETTAMYQHEPDVIALRDAV